MNERSPVYTVYNTFQSFHHSEHSKTQNQSFLSWTVDLKRKLQIFNRFFYFCLFFNTNLSSESVSAKPISFHHPLLHPRGMFCGLTQLVLYPSPRRYCGKSSFLLGVHRRTESLSVHLLWSWQWHSVPTVAEDLPNSDSCNFVSIRMQKCRAGVSRGSSTIQQCGTEVLRSR